MLTKDGVEYTPGMTLYRVSTERDLPWVLPDNMEWFEDVRDEPENEWDDFVADRYASRYLAAKEAEARMCEFIKRAKTRLKRIRRLLC